MQRAIPLLLLLTAFVFPTAAATPPTPCNDDNGDLILLELRPVIDAVAIDTGITSGAQAVCVNDVSVVSQTVVSTGAFTGVTETISTCQDRDCQMALDTTGAAIGPGTTLYVWVDGAQVLP
ncbi:MAG: hypothetical protein QOE90_793 [Thermoplasmata archaeon]|jgi:hypothetical protein|nr:hypothetical protein [Thermoplasmata archaeon]